MSDIIKTGAVVLSKLDYGDSSVIVSLYTNEKGKLSAILKGGRSPKSKLSHVVDPINYLEVIIYNKPSRDIQILTEAAIKGHFPKIKSDLEKLKYAHSVMELIKNLTVDHEENHRLFQGIVRILELIEDEKEPPALLFGRFFLFFLKEIGYEVQINKCGKCGKATLTNQELSYNNEIGILCNDCRKNYPENFRIDAELFNYMMCLKLNKNPGNVRLQIMESAVSFMEKFLKHHVSDFKGLQSLKMFKNNFS
jgi:DNA repair protein RecO (recombination protein O)